MWLRCWRVNWAVVYGATLHLTWSVLLLCSSQPLLTTPMGNFPMQNQYLAALWFLLVGVTAIISMRWDRNLFGAMLLMPQQATLMLSAFTAGSCIWNGHYFDLEPRPRVFIAADQLPSILAMVIHTFALLDWHVWSRRNLRCEAPDAKLGNTFGCSRGLADEFHLRNVATAPSCKPPRDHLAK